MLAVKKRRKNAKQVTEESPITPKRKRIVLDLRQKEDIIKRIEAGESHDKIAAEYNVGVSTVYQIVNRCSNLFNREENSNSLMRKVFKASDFPLIEHALKKWFFQELARKNFFSMALLAKKSLHFYSLFLKKDIEMKPFKGSLGFIQKFCARYNIKSKKEKGKSEYLTLATTGTEEYLEKFNSIIHKYSTDQIYTVDEFNLNYICIPEVERNNERVSLMLCTNSTAEHKLPIVLTHNFTNLEFNLNFPVFLTHSKNSYLNQELFENWFHNEFVPKVTDFLTKKNLEPKALLLIDHSPIHTIELKSSDGKIECLFIPCNSNLVHPLRQGVFSSLKRKYKVRFLDLLVKTGQSEIEEALKKLNFEKIVDLIGELWDQMQVDFIQSTWHKLNLNLNVECPIEELNLFPVSLDLMEFGMEFSDEYLTNWLLDDKYEPGFYVLNDEEIVETAIEKFKEKKSEENEEINDEGEVGEVSENMDVELEHVITNEEAIGMCDELVKFCTKYKIDIISSLSIIKSIALENKENKENDSEQVSIEPNIDKNPSDPPALTTTKSSISIVKRNKIS
ncbi:unnamed protein product [Brachionus calyciflorus]|uniref:Uncharacterized protein n=1 Tax=Brachionus calyciflorus TaxID=104777 RepID=A0A813PLT8_9BILA|nr:unnamed protein product [Brachionus calyciflorus]